MSFPNDCCPLAADILRRNSQTCPEPQMMLLCADALDETAGDLAACAEQAHASRNFVGESTSLLRDICRHADAMPERLFDNCFALVECLAVILRECQLRNPARQASPAQAALLRYFEKSGHWRPEDSTLVTYFYYTLLPSTVAAA